MTAELLIISLALLGEDFNSKIELTQAAKLL